MKVSSFFGRSDGVFPKVGRAILTEAIFLTANVRGHSTTPFAWSGREPYPEGAKTLCNGSL